MAASFFRHLEQCPVCPARLDTLWSRQPQSLPNDPAQAAPLATSHATSSSELTRLLDRNDRNTYDLSFLPRPPFPSCLGQLADYELLRVIGAGGMGMVFLARDSRDNQLVALKALKQGASASQKARQRFMREALTTQSIQHRGVVRILGVGESAGIVFHVMPLLEGENFEKLLRRKGPLPLAQVVKYTRQAAEALEAAHQLGIFHRDIKPSNLWLQKPGAAGEEQVLLLDFGLALAEFEEVGITSTGVVIGTPAYLSPEQAEGTATIGPASDLFSLGCVLYEMLVGSRVFPGTNTLEIFRTIAAFRITPPNHYRREIPERLNSLVMSLLAKSPNKRPGSARALLDQLADPLLLKQPLLNRRSVLTSGIVVAVGLAGLGLWKITRPAPVPLMQPTLILQTPGAIAMALGMGWNQANDGQTIIWADHQGRLWRMSLPDQRAQEFGQVNFTPALLRFSTAFATLAVCGTFGEVQVFRWQDKPVALGVKQRAPVQGALTDAVWDTAQNRLLVACGNEVSVWSGETGRLTATVKPRFGAPVTSLVPRYPDIGSAWVATMVNGEVGIFNDRDHLVLQKVLVNSPATFRLAIRPDGVHAAVWSESGQIDFWQPEEFSYLLKTNILPETVPLQPEGEPAPIRAPLQPRWLTYTPGGSTLMMLGDREGAGEAFLYNPMTNRMLARLGVDDPVLLTVDYPQLWALDRGGSLHLFDTFMGAS